MAGRALFAGSFDPITNGHIDIIKRASKLFDELCVAVVVNPNKSSMFTLDERVALIAAACADIENVCVSSFDGLLADFVNDNGFDAVVRGLRNLNDFTVEQEMANINSQLYVNGTETVFLISSPENSYISSSMVKEIAMLGGNVESFVPESVLNAILNNNGGIN